MSYHTEDGEHVSKIVDALIEQGFEPFCKFRILPGENIDLAIESALRNSRHFALCSGYHDARVSDGYPLDWREQEFIGDQCYYLDNPPEIIDKYVPLRSDGPVPLIPILLPDSDSKNLPSNLKRLQPVDLREGITPERLAPLFRALSARKIK